MMHSTHSHDAIIAGGGMVGLALAVAAARSGLRVAVLEKNRFSTPEPEAGHYSARVSAINHASERLLKNLGAWDHIPANRLSPYHDMAVWDGLGTGQLAFSADDVQTTHLGHIIENRFIVNALLEAARSHAGIDLFTEETVTDWQQHDHGIEVRTSLQQSLSAAVLVGSEGKFSPIRERADIDTWQWDYHHIALVTTVRHEHRHQRTASQVFLETGPLAFLPLKDSEDSEQYSSVVWSVQSDQADALMALTDDEFSQRLTQAFEERYGSILAVDPRQAFPLQAQQARRYHDGRVVIVGDAAHTVHPLAGLGVNLGFLDAATLADCWDNTFRQQGDIGHEFTQRRYQRQRQSHNLAVAALMEALKRGFGTQAPLPLLARNTGLQFINRHPILKRPLILGALGDTGVPLPPLCQIDRG